MTNDQLPWSALLCDRDPDNLHLTYVSSPLGAPTREGVLKNYKRTLYAMSLLAQEGKVPLAGHVLYPLFLDEHIPTDRTLGILFDMVLLPVCQEMICFTPDGTAATLSSGMKADVKRAVERDIDYTFRVLPELPERWNPSWLMPSLDADLIAEVDKYTMVFDSPTEGQTNVLFRSSLPVTGSNQLRDFMQKVVAHPDQPINV